MTTIEDIVHVTDQQALLDHEPVSFQHAVAQIKALQRMLFNANGSSTENARRHKHDIELIGKRLIDEANDRGWCSIYDEVVADLNEHLHLGLQERERSFTVRVTATVTFEIEVENETSADDAREIARDWIESDASEYINNVTKVSVDYTEVVE